MDTQEIKVDNRWLAEQVQEYSIKGVVACVAQLIESGKIPPGSRLPSARKLGKQLGMSMVSISEAWGILAEKKMVIRHKRKGVWVKGISNPGPGRFHTLDNESSPSGEKIKLLWPYPDTTLLPDFKKALQYSLSVKDIHEYKRVPIITELESQAKKSWPYAAEAFVTSEGGYDGLNVIIDALFFRRPVICIAAPYPPLLVDVLEKHNAKIIYIACDNDGPLPGEIEKALAFNPSAFIYQPNVHLITGYSISKERMSDLFYIMKKSNMLIIEHDIIGSLFSDSLLTFGELCPEKTIYVRSYTKDYSPDLRLAIISGSYENIKKIHSYRDFGISWSSRFIQGALAWLLQDNKTNNIIKHAREIYDKRRYALAEALIRRGVETGNHNGFTLWLKVPSENYAVKTLAEHNILVTPGIRYGNNQGQYLRVTVSRLKLEQVEKIAYALALACCEPVV